MAALVHILSRLEAALHCPQVRADTAHLRVLLHPGFEEVGRSGQHYSLQDTLLALRHESQASEGLTADLKPAPTQPMHADHYAATELAPGVALLTYRSADRLADGSLGRHSLRSSIWIQAGEGHWQLRYHQGTAAAKTWQL